MEQIGKKLQDKREKLNLTILDISKVTKLSAPHIKAIERGDLDYFKNDLTYVRFYVRSYCKAIDVPYENFKDDIYGSIEEYTSTQAMKVIKDHELVEEHIEAKKKEIKNNKKIAKEDRTIPKIAKKDRTSIQKNTQQTSRFKRKKIDVAFLSLIVVVVAIVLILVYVVMGTFFYIDTEAKKDEKITDNGKTPIPEEDLPEEPQKTEESKSEVSYTMINSNMYDVNKLKANEAIKIEIEFKADCWFDATMNGGALANTQTNKIFKANEVFTYTGVVGANDVYTIIFGNFASSQIKVNGVEVTYDDVLKSSVGVQTVVLNVRGE